MPIIDCEDYSQSAMSYAIGAIEEAILAAGNKPRETKLSYVNIYFGTHYLGTQDGSNWHVLVPRPYGFLAIIFHFVRHGDVVQTKEPERSDARGLCISLLWTSKARLCDEFLDALQTANSAVEKTEMLYGQPFPLPLRVGQFSNTVPIRTLDPEARDEERISVATVNLPGKSESKLLPNDPARIEALLKGFDINGDSLRASLIREMMNAASWQQRAIRAIGLEDWAASVVASNIWIETLAICVARHFNIAAGNSTEKFDGELKAKGITKFIVTHLGSKFLGGQWDHTKIETAFGKWHFDCYSLRNKIVHSGYVPTAEEAGFAYAACNKLAWHISHLAASKQVQEIQRFSDAFVRVKTK